MLCEDENSYFSLHLNGYSTSSPPSPTLSLSTGRPSVFDRADSFCSSLSSYSISSQSPVTPSSPGTYGLPLSDTAKSENLDSSNYSNSLTPLNLDPSLSPSPTIPTQADNSTIKRLARKYTCRCSKSFTTSGHLARHTRIHTGEKNYPCLWEGCGARFSRQDNCMQHFRTHTTGSTNKRTVRKRRIESPATSNDSSQSRFSPQYSETPFPSENGLAALANVAISGYI